MEASQRTIFVRRIFRSVVTPKHLSRIRIDPKDGAVHVSEEHDPVAVRGRNPNFFKRVGLPNFFAGLCIHRVIRILHVESMVLAEATHLADHDLPVDHSRRDAAIPGRFELPDFLARIGIERIHESIRATDINDAIHDGRRPHQSPAPIGINEFAVDPITIEDPVLPKHITRLKIKGIHNIIATTGQETVLSSCEIGCDTLSPQPLAPQELRRVALVRYSGYHTVQCRHIEHIPFHKRARTYPIAEALLPDQFSICLV